MKISPQTNLNISTTKTTDAKATEEARQRLTTLATQAVAQTIATNAAAGQTPQVTADHPLLKNFGEALGMGLGVIVTEALQLVPSWNTAVVGPDGKPVKDIPGATRVGNHDILKRHEEVVGPKIAALVAKMPPGAVHDLLAGLADGATRAPGESYRLEAAISDAFEG